MALVELLSSVNRAPAECVVHIDGQPIDDLYPFLISAQVDADRSRWTVGTLRFETRRSEDGSWIVQDDDRFLPWKTVKVEAVFGDVVEEVMRGYIKTISADYPNERGSATVTVTCQDDSLLMDREHIDQRWGEDTPTTDGNIAAEIAARHNVILLGTPGQGQTVQDLNQNSTDIKFLQKRAQANGYEIIFREGAIHFGEMRLDAETQPTILIYAGRDTNCLSFSVGDDGHSPDRVAYQVAAEVGSESQVQEVTPNLRQLGMRPADSSASGLNDFVWRPQRAGVADETQMQSIAQQAANRSSMRIQGTGELDGSRYGHVLLTGEPVGVDGAGEKYSGTWYVSAARHTFDGNGYMTAFTLIRNAYGDDLGGGSNPLAGVL